MALIGNILMTVNTVLTLIFVAFGSFVFGEIAKNGYSNSRGFNFDGDYYDLGEYHSDMDWQIFVSDILPWIIGFVILILLICLVMNVFTWIAFAKMEGPHGRGWRIFLLVMGILNIGSLFAGIFFILAFALNANSSNRSGEQLASREE
jgi:uncharacterized membrane protein